MSRVVEIGAAVFFGCLALLVLVAASLLVWKLAREIPK